ncbi:MAG: GspH/FimT family pseudopilin [Rhodoferax sp.]|nr:GspH/FimT family pseudopilin [Rhodoferax sp.]
MKQNNRTGVASSLRDRQRGYSLMEVVVVIAIVGILARIAAPAFGDIVANYYLKQLRNAVYKSANLARAEAINRGTCVAVCMTKPSTAASTMSCVPGTAASLGKKSNWASGWMVFEYPACSTVENGTTVNLDKIIYVQAAFTNKYQAIRATGPDGFIYNANGVAYNAMGSFLIQENGDTVPYELICINWYGKLTSRSGSTC